ncbi:DUF6925 family protein [Pseudonocardia bannensis]|uniref:Uncharacterized protein n=1 Tax=Pseudonocardia bannensis TaxID=630973 RepID=A0A848DSF4_9PSEU|nr:hypothetical protein [Pseudonocardia bannensis]NMH95455.1 hypothetical protein [Pseudonocardia bannensis]
MAGPATPPPPDMPDETDPADAPMRLLVSDQLADPAAGWGMGTLGALAEFARDSREPASRGPSSVVTPRGGIQLVLPGGVVAVAYETPAGPDLHWHHAIAFCLPADAARRSVRTAVTELGPDGDAMRPQDAGAILFDLGLGTPTVDACVRTADPGLIAELRAAEGRSLFDPELGLAAVVAAHSPHRVFVTACGRIEVFTAIPPPGGRSPVGPHTHLLPHLLQQDRTHPATAPIPEGWVPAAHLYPAHPAADQAGRPLPFDAARHAAFQALLVEFGDPVLGAVKAGVIAAVRARRGPEGEYLPTHPPARATVAVALRQLARTDGTSAAFHAWRRQHAATPDLIDPEEGPNPG